MFGLFQRQPVGSGVDFDGAVPSQGLLGGFSDPRTMGLLGASAAMLEASGPSRLPVSLGQVIGRGFGGGVGGLMQAQQLQQGEQMQELRNAQMEELKRKGLADAQQRGLIEQFAQTLPADQRQRFLVDPAGYIKATQPKAPEPYTLAPGGIRFGPDNKPLAEAPTKPQESPLARLVAEQKALPSDSPLHPIYKQAIERASTHQPPVATIDLRQDSKFNEKLGSELGEQYSALLKADMSAPSNIGKYQRLGQLLGSVNTGKFRGSITEMKAAAKAMGFDLTAMGIADDVAPAQAARALSNQIALELRNPAGGAGMPGALSDKDREFLIQSIPGLENDPAAIGKMIEYRVKLEQRAQKVARMAREYRKKHGRFNEGFYDELQEWSNMNPLFSDDKGPAPAPAKTPAVIPFGSLGRGR